MRVTVLGSGTSVGIPSISCGCEVCRSEVPENQRLRSSVYIEHPGASFLIDCSIDFRQQALRHRMPAIEAVLLTHSHADHISGLDDLRSYNFLQSAPIDIWGDATTLEAVRQRFAYCFRPTQIGGGLPRLNLREVQPTEPFRIGTVTVQPVPIKHGILDILGYRIGGLAYLTDCSAVPASSMPLIEGVDTLIVGALRPYPHETHFSLPEALALSRELDARQTWFTHIGCKLEHFATNAELPPEAQLLYDGQILEAPDATTL